MTLSSDTPAAPWWQTLLATVINLGIGLVAQHYLGNTAAGATMAAGTAVAHALPSPSQQIKPQKAFRARA